MATRKIKIMYAGYITPIKMYGPVVTPITVSDDMALMLIRCGYEIKQMNASTNTYEQLTVDNFETIDKVVVPTPKKEAKKHTPVVEPPKPAVVEPEPVQEPVKVEEVITDTVVEEAQEEVVADEVVTDEEVQEEKKSSKKSKKHN